MAEQKTKRWKHLIIKILHVASIFSLVFMALEHPRKMGSLGTSDQNPNPRRNTQTP